MKGCRPDAVFFRQETPAVHAGKGAAYEGLGDVTAARASYRRAESLLARADADFAPALARIRQRLAALR